MRKVIGRGKITIIKDVCCNAHGVGNELSFLVVTMVDD
jgi:hypothetical protein